MNDFESKLEEYFSKWLDGMTGQAADRIDVEVTDDGLSGTITWSVTFNTDSFDPYYGDEDDTSADVDEEEFDRQIIEQTTEHVEEHFFEINDKKEIDRKMIGLYNSMGINVNNLSSIMSDPTIDYNYAEQSYAFEIV